MSPERISSSDAAALLRGCEGLDPRGICGPDDIAAMCDAGECYAIAAPVGAVYVLQRTGGVVWVDAAKAVGSADATAALVEAVEAQAEGASAIAFQTSRRGFARKLEPHGYTVTGYIVRKALK